MGTLGSGQVIIEAEPALDLSGSEDASREPGFLNSTLALDVDQPRLVDALLVGTGTIAVPEPTLVPHA